MSPVSVGLGHISGLRHTPPPAPAAVGAGGEPRKRTAPASGAFFAFPPEEDTMGLSVNGQNSAADGIAAVAVFSSLHTGDPSTTGANEATGGSPAYARKAVAWSAASAGQRVSSGSQTFDVAAGTYYWVGKFSLVTAGVFYGAAPLGGQTPKGANAIITTGVITSYAHGYANADRVVLEQIEANALPTGFTEGVVYFVTNATTDTFTVSLTSGGSTVTCSTSGALWVQKVIPEVFAGQGQLTIAAGSDAIDARFA